jgi:endonuclease/exonuclease/phosphatase family metal-dependent hydrolase
MSIHAPHRVSGTKTWEGLQPAAQSTQNTILHILSELSADTADDVIIMGDFNEINPRCILATPYFKEQMASMLGTELQFWQGNNTTPTLGNHIADYILHSKVKGEGHPVEFALGVQDLHTATHQHGSDHRQVFAQVHLN